ncbi:MAG: leucine-rich repeat domain-containing protein, partial [Paludibacteraceae bacterium]|nr:leucine-rich repeat domain-containing protein [Paludibacteraceae bacterium]
MKTKLFLLMLALMVGIGKASAESGTCGDNLTWDLTDGILTISGTEEMENFSYNTVPWYSSRSAITTVNIENGVTSIGYCAFYGCSSLTSIAIPNGVTSIGYCAFYGCSSLTSIAIPNSVTSIGDYALYYCISLTSVTIPNSVTSIGMSAFNSCWHLTSVTIPNSVTSIGYYAFYNVCNIVYYGSATGSPWGARSVNGFVDGYLVYSDETKTNLLACSSAFVGELTIPNSVTS